MKKTLLKSVIDCPRKVCFKSPFKTIRSSTFFCRQSIGTLIKIAILSQTVFYCLLLLFIDIEPQ